MQSLIASALTVDQSAGSLVKMDCRLGAGRVSRLPFVKLIFVVHSLHLLWFALRIHVIPIDLLPAARQPATLTVESTLNTYARNRCNERVPTPAISLDKAHYRELNIQGDVVKRGA